MNGNGVAQERQGAQTSPLLKKGAGPTPKVGSRGDYPGL